MVQWKGRGGVASESQGITPSHALLEAARRRDDSVAIWCKTGVGQGQKGVGSEQQQKKKAMLTDGTKGRELIDLLSAFFSEAHLQTEAPMFITCNANVTARTLHLGIWKCDSNSAIQHVIA